jgi:uncharacterized OsmC-like protein
MTMICNGIDTDQLATFGELVVTDPDAARVTASVQSRWEGRYGTSVTTGAFTFGGERFPRDASMALDRPQALGGADQGPAPGELLLAALGSCVAQTFVEAAAMTGVAIERLVITAEGHLDLRGNAGVDGVRPGLSRIDLDVEVDAAVDDEVVTALLADAVRRSPVADSLAAGVTIDTGAHRAVPAQLAP